MAITQGLDGIATPYTLPFVEQYPGEQFAVHSFGDQAATVYLALDGVRVYAFPAGAPSENPPLQLGAGVWTLTGDGADTFNGSFIRGL